MASLTEHIIPCFRTSVLYLPSWTSYFTVSVCLNPSLSLTISDSPSSWGFSWLTPAHAGVSSLNSYFRYSQHRNWFLVCVELLSPNKWSMSREQGLLFCFVSVPHHLCTFVTPDGSFNQQAMTETLPSWLHCDISTDGIQQPDPIGKINIICTFCYSSGTQRGPLWVS